MALARVGVGSVRRGRGGGLGHGGMYWSGTRVVRGGENSARKREVGSTGEVLLMRWQARSSALRWAMGVHVGGLSVRVSSRCAAVDVDGGDWRGEVERRAVEGEQVNSNGGCASLASALVTVDRRFPVLGPACASASAQALLSALSLPPSSTSRSPWTTHPPLHPSLATLCTKPADIDALNARSPSCRHPHATCRYLQERPHLDTPVHADVRGSASLVSFPLIHDDIPLDTSTASLRSPSRALDVVALTIDTHRCVSCILSFSFEHRRPPIAYAVLLSVLQSHSLVPPHSSLALVLACRYRTCTWRSF